MVRKRDVAKLVASCYFFFSNFAVKNPHSNKDLLLISRKFKDNTSSEAVFITRVQGLKVGD